ncbi:MAG TPA: antibiotic biosynthesis monooxygenase [Myxococcaceae bacterium]|nr:antibiotic biosynthesis monooxygenase [Myxococcaceae bacterium]
MIIRVWTAHATPEGAEKSRARFVEHVLPEKLRPLDGYLGASLLRRPDGDEIELLLLTRWESLAALRAFAGPEIDSAVVDEEAKTILTRYDSHVRHYEVSFEDDGSAPAASRRAPPKTRPRPSKTTGRSGRKGR